uniref:Uncharacterized protein n=1 Tax=Chromera velia CCMP2878 TaxID=1169474 RepID=A0A0G4G669_9ALVE|mmetsp:Transcript_36677/g.72144  ORF Transcript_36677/g.72144 Transcript_36677/m.72144 type:complete len:216 (+) Transcript_36677:107-754(+)|eukprot:Cvel_20356.t1-p1 / transcript=Cvel_20356.t1 / gene=Cvel_20356 / organism=Chromera_velia_CCMP2878 / gene_product=hypothetical protein / transcript_product=hypothetical protein / location=Cvel_scaffold1820:23837-24593(-) / protein_length=215 / sequence_SO=supercontig / SO=protein_coding / is_pseudo=false
MSSFNLAAKNAVGDFCLKFPRFEIDGVKAANFIVDDSGLGATSGEHIKEYFNPSDVTQRESLSLAGKKVSIVSGSEFKKFLVSQLSPSSLEPVAAQNPSASSGKGEHSACLKRKAKETEKSQPPSALTPPSQGIEEMFKRQRKAEELGQAKERKPGISALAFSNKPGEASTSSPGVNGIYHNFGNSYQDQRDAIEKMTVEELVAELERRKNFELC